ncbi:MAG TPA: hypothetical protein VLX90_14475, partial [Steroidobacteraceae bacterium]|nr:hypothetical protein [Steroidobacteraceae bacterium]
MRLRASVICHSVLVATGSVGTATSCLAIEPVDLLLVHGKVITVDDQFSIQSAVAVKNGRIVEVGGNEL